MPFNENHKRRLLTTFQHIDKLLAQAAANLGLVEGDLLFPSGIPDVTPTQRQVIADSLASFRKAARGFLRTVPVSPDPLAQGALWSLHMALDFIWVALAELEPKQLASYGALDADSAAQTEEMLEKLQSIIREIKAYLEREMNGDVSVQA
jgi:hypothetical protein